MYNPIRRNRNIGTSQQGKSQNNHLEIPWPWMIGKHFTERLTKYETFSRYIQDHEFLFVVEETRKDSLHACSIEDILSLLAYISPQDYVDLRLIIFRQPKRKEEILRSAWGRLIYSYEFEGNHEPAIILEAVDYTRQLKWSKHLKPDRQAELERLRADGHQIEEDKRYFTAQYEPRFVRQTQLYRTLPHEIGHYVQYLETVVRPAKPDESSDEWYKRDDAYFAIPNNEKEAFAHRYADTFCEKMKKKGIIPFEPLNPTWKEN
ncbi:MAG: hypothetical protein AAFP89_04715 [Bacteroidota bacterium]